MTLPLSSGFLAATSDPPKLEKDSMSLPRILLALFFVSVVAASVLTSGLAQSDKVGALTIIDPWARATPPMAQTAGGYLMIENSGEGSDRLVAAASPVANRTEIHEMSMSQGIMTMRRLEDGLDIPAGGTITLAPGGAHIMLMGLKEALVAGETVPVTLEFEVAGEVETYIQVLGLGAQGPSGHDPEGPAKSGSGN